jgi:predicted TIM-barrel fold metal-dependent hydrolase
MAMSKVARQHPVVDADAHWLEPIGVFLQFLRDAGGTAAVQKLTEFYDEADGAWYRANAGERNLRRIKRRAWWSDPWIARDRATAMLPKLMHERLPELGIEFAVVYPTLGLTAISYPDPDLRIAACRALNAMTAELFDGLGDRLAPAAAIPVVTPSEAVEELHHAAHLGFKAILFAGSIIRSPTSGGGRPYVDTVGLDSLYDWDPFWRACSDLRVAVADHGGAQTWPDRQSPTNFVYNHVGR